jgi:superoxide reductase
MRVYKCNICGNIVEVLHAGIGKLVCCGQPMELLEERATGEGKEKHVPVVEKAGNLVKIRVGEVLHPMEEAHFIEWVELIAGDKVYREFLKPGDAPMVVLAAPAGRVSARAYCNIHGLWES